MFRNKVIAAGYYFWVKLLALGRVRSRIYDVLDLTKKPGGMRVGMYLSVQKILADVTQPFRS